MRVERGVVLTLLQTVASALALSVWARGYAPDELSVSVINMISLRNNAPATIDLQKIFEVDELCGRYSNVHLSNRTGRCEFSLLIRIPLLSRSVLRKLILPAAPLEELPG